MFNKVASSGGVVERGNAKLITPGLYCSGRISALEFHCGRVQLIFLMRSSSRRIVATTSGFSASSDIPLTSFTVDLGDGANKVWRSISTIAFDVDGAFESKVASF